MKQSEIKELSVADCKKNLQDSKETILILKWHMHFSFEKPFTVKSLRKTVARLATELTNRALQVIN